MPRPTARVLALLELLQAGGVRTVHELADRLGVDERTVRRYVDHLLELDVPVESIRGRYGGYRIGSGYRLPPLMLTDDEAVATALGLIAGRRAGLFTDSLAAAETASAKLRRVLPAPLAARLDALLAEARFTGDAAGGSPPDSAVLLTAAEAVHERRPLRLAYENGDGELSARTVLPWGIVSHSGRWYLTGPDSASGEVRTFRLDRISGAEIGEGRFVVPERFDPARHLLAGLARAPWANEVCVLVDAPVARIRERFPESVATVSAVPGVDGRFRVRLRAEHLDWVAGALAALDEVFVIESPDALRAEVTALADRLAVRAAAR